MSESQNGAIEAKNKRRGFEGGDRQRKKAGRRQRAEKTNLKRIWSRAKLESFRLSQWLFNDEWKGL